MDRGSTSAFQTEIVKSANKPFHLLVLSFDDVVYYLSDAYIPVTYNGNEYTCLLYTSPSPRDRG